MAVIHYVPYGIVADIAELPRENVAVSFPSVTGTTHNCANAGAFTTALATAVGGDEIVLTANFSGSFQLPNRGENGWILIRSDNASWQSASGTRVTSATNMRTITASTGNSAITTATGAHHYYFCGVNFKANASSFTYNLVQIGNSESVLANIPTDIIFDRCYLQGDATLGCRRGIELDGIRCAVVHSRFSDFKETDVSGGDSQAINFFNTPGPLLILNCYLEASTENMNIGGSDPQVTNMIPSDITIRGCHMFKPLAWNGAGLTVKNLFEMKLGRRVLVEKCLLENNWEENQQGYAVVIGPRNQNNSAPWSTIEDVTFRYNKIKNTGQGFSIFGDDDNYTSQRMSRVLFENNVVEVTRVNAETGNIFTMTRGPVDVNVRKNTWLITVAGGEVGIFDCTPKAERFVMKDNIISGGSYGLIGSGTAEGTATLNGHTNNYTFTNNVLIGLSSGSYPANNYFPANTAAVGFTNYAGGDYTLSGSSTYKGDASDGGDPGANAVLVETYAAAALNGTAT